MAKTTEHYNLPTVEDGDNIDGAEQITALAEAIDAALYQISQQISPAYTLPVASADVLGGVRVGSGLSVTPEGVLSSTGVGKLPVATTSTLGAVKVGTGLSVASDGLLSVDLDALVNTGHTWGDMKATGFLRRGGA